MTDDGNGSGFATWLHALIVGGIATGGWLATHDALWIGAGVVFSSRFAGAIIGRWIRPHRRRTVLVHGTAGEVTAVQRRAHRRVHKLVSILTALSAEIDFAADEARHELGDLNGHSEED